MSADGPASRPAKEALRELQTTFSKVLRDQNFSYVLANPRLPDCPIVFASPTFFSLTGYSVAEVLGRNCNFLQGIGTSRQAVLEIRDALREERPCDVCLLNYRKDRSPFWNCFHLEPIRGDEGAVDYYLGIQADVTRAIEASGLPTAALAPGSVEPTVHEEHQAAAEIAHMVHEHSQELRQKECGMRGLCAADGSMPAAMLCAMTRLQGCFMLADAALPNTPIVYASPAFLRMSGYCDSGEVLGRDFLHFLQGPSTDQRQVQELHNALSAVPPRPATVTLLSYQKNGTPFFNCAHVAPVRDADGTIRFIASCHLDISANKPGSGVAGQGSNEQLERSAAVQPLNVAAQPTQLQLLQQKGVVAALRVAARALAAHGLRRESGDQALPTA